MLGDAAEAMHCAVDGLLAQDISGHSDAALGADLIAFRRDVERIEAEFAPPPSIRGASRLRRGGFGQHGVVA